MKRLIAGLVLVVILLGMVACAKAPIPTPTPMPTPIPRPTVVPAPAPPPAAVPAPSIIIPNIISGATGSKDSSSIPPPVIVQTPPPVTVTTPSEADLGQAWAVERMIVRTGEISLVVTDVANAIEQIAALAENYDGYVVSSNSWREGDRLAGAIAVRVPAERFDDAIRALRQMAVEVTQESTTSKDVTEEYVDLSAKLHNLEASEAQLLELMKKAGKVQEILEVQRELTNTRGEIEQTKGRMQYLEQTSSTSLIQVHLQQSALDVNFSASNRRPKEGQSVYFNPQIAGGVSPYSYEWNFGDGSTSTDVTPTHAYKSEGSYNVTLKVTDDLGNTDTRDRDNYIEVLPGWNASGIAGGAWNGLVVFGHVVADILIWLGVFSPVWIVIGGIIYLVYWWRRRRKTKA